MIPAISPNRVVVYAVLAFVAYWIASLFVPAAVLRDVFNSLAFGAAVVIVVTWAPSAFKAVKANANRGEWQLILAIFMTWFVVLLQRSYAIVFNWYGRPETWAESAVTGFWPYSFLIAGLLYLAAPSIRGDGLANRGLWMMLSAVALGSFVAGVLFWASVSTVI